jgi:tetratricopeptide (TPR) repeat protein
VINRFHIITLLLLGTTFLGITAWKQWSTSGPTEAVDSQRTTAAQDSIRRFWETFRRATDLRTAGDLTEAASAYEQALAWNPEHEDTRYYLGNVYYMLDKTDRARQQWEQLLEINPNSARAYVQLGELYFCSSADSLPDISAAEPAYRRALDLHNEETLPLLRLGQIALLRRNYSEAQELFDAVVGSNYRNAYAYFLKGYLLWKKGLSEQSMIHAARARRYAESGSITASEHVNDEAPTVRLQTNEDCSTVPLPELTRPGDTNTDLYTRFENNLLPVRRALEL